MAEEHAPDDFNWVAAQATCNAASMFDRLRARVKEDVQRRNGLFDQAEDWTFEFHEEGDDEFEVVRVGGSGFTGPKVSAVVQFERAGRRIRVHSEDLDVEFTLVVIVDTAGHCRFVVGEAMYSDWEIRRMALEQLFFEENDEAE
ncbi:MAG TPA: hypothetical protein VI485_25120 [Vicinamibacterales bacterium]|nr:hypothetical protein [Vicinamibacterales bacterium]